MTKEDAVNLLGGPERQHQVAAQALRINKATFSLWPEELNGAQTDRVVGAAVRLGIDIPQNLAF